MLIYCPKCRQGYNVEETLIPDEGRKLRCSSCGEVFKFGRDGETAVVNMPLRQPAVEISEEENPETQPEETAVKAAELETAEEEAGAAADDENAAEQPQAPAAADTESVAAEVAADTEPAATETAEPEPEIDEPVDINDIFKRLSEQTEGLFEKEKKLNSRERMWLKFKTLTGWNLRLKFKYILLFLLIIAGISLYNNRYDIARKFPWSAPLYGMFGIKAQILGEGLEFQNIDWVYFDNKETPRLEIKGFINNTTRRSLKIPTVHVEMLDENTNLLKSQNQPSGQEVLKGKSRIPLNIVVNKPSPTTKYVFLTFVESD